MRLGLFGRVRRLASRAIGKFTPGSGPGGLSPKTPAAGVGGRGSHRRTRSLGPVRAEPRALGRTQPEPRPVVDLTQPGPARSQPVVTGTARAAIRTRPAVRTAMAQPQRRAQARPDEVAVAEARPWFEAPPAGHVAAGRRHCGCLEDILHRDWVPDAVPAAETVTAINRLAELPQLIKEKLAAGLEAIHVGPGGVPDLDDMGELKGVLLPSGRATWDACAGAYGDKKIIVGSRPSPTPDVMCHEIGHALDDIDGSAGQWQSDSAEFHRLYQRCLPRMASEFHRQHGTLGRREFFADAFAAIASGQRPALVEMLGGDTRAALDVMLYFNVRYGI